MRSGVRDQPEQHGETLSLLKIQMCVCVCVWLRTPVIPATQEAEVQESLEPRGRVCCELRLHQCKSGLDSRVRLKEKKKKNE